MQPLQGNAWSYLLSHMVRFSETILNCPVSFAEMVTDHENKSLPNSHGVRTIWHNPYTLKVVHQTIQISTRFSMNQQVKVMAHELGHAMIHLYRDEIYNNYEYLEIEAEWFAFNVLQKLGHDSSTYSNYYIECWANRLTQGKTYNLTTIRKGFKPKMTQLVDYLEDSVYAELKQKKNQRIA